MQAKNIIFNNVVIMLVHILICAISFILFSVSSGAIHKLIIALATLGLYYLIGRVVLRNTHKLGTNILSIILLVIITVPGIFLMHSLPDYLVITLINFNIIFLPDALFPNMNTWIQLIALIFVFLIQPIVVLIGLKQNKINW